MPRLKHYPDDFTHPTPDELRRGGSKQSMCGKFITLPNLSVYGKEVNCVQCVKLVHKYSEQVQEEIAMQKRLVEEATGQPFNVYRNR